MALDACHYTVRTAAGGIIIHYRLDSKHKVKLKTGATVKLITDICNYWAFCVGTKH